jgi:hypothetical protein
MVTLSSSGARVDLELRKGAAFARTITYKVNGATTNISGYTFAGQIRAIDGTLAASLTVTVVNAAAGTVSISLSSATTAGMTVGQVYNWDFEVTISGTTTELLRGLVTVLSEQTT